MASADSFLVIGHRGAAGLEPENTLRSFERALRIGVDAVELDVYCVDGNLVVIHDDTLERTTNGRGKVMAMSYEALRQFDAGKGERIPTLDEVLDLVAGRVTVNVELKGKGTAAPLAEHVAAHPNDDLLVSSFDHRELEKFRAAAPKARVAPLFHKASSRMFEIADALGAWSINLSVEIALPDRLRAITDNGYRSLVYTVNDPTVAKRLRSDGAGGVFTDYPDRMQAFRE